MVSECSRKVRAVRLTTFVDEIERTLGRDAILPNLRDGEAYMQCECTPDHAVWPLVARVEDLVVIAVCQRCGERL